MLALCIAGAFVCFLAAAGAAFLPAPWWQRALHAFLVAAGAESLLVVAWVLGRRTGRTSVVGGAAAGLMVGTSLVCGAGPGRIPAGGPISIDLPAWVLADFGLAGALGLLGFGIVLARGGGPVGLVGVAAVVAGILSVQPALRSLGLPTVGAVGLVVATLALLAVGRFLRRPQEGEGGE